MYSNATMTTSDIFASILIVGTSELFQMTFNDFHATNLDEHPRTPQNYSKFLFNTENLASMLSQRFGVFEVDVEQPMYSQNTNHFQLLPHAFSDLLARLFLHFAINIPREAVERYPFIEAVQDERHIQSIFEHFSARTGLIDYMAMQLIRTASLRNEFIEFDDWFCNYAEHCLSLVGFLSICGAYLHCTDHF